MTDTDVAHEALDPGMQIFHINIEAQRLALELEDIELVELIAATQAHLIDIYIAGAA